MTAGQHAPDSGRIRRIARAAAAARADAMAARTAGDGDRAAAQRDEASRLRRIVAEG